MKAGRAWTLQSLLSCMIWNGLLVAVLYFVALRVLQGLDAWVTPLLQPEVQNLPDDLRGSLMSFKQFLDEARTYLLPVVAGTAGTTTLVLWLFLSLQGRALLRRAASEGASSTSATRELQGRHTTTEDSQKPVPAAPLEPSIQPAVQILSALQQEGRLIDFLQEDLNLYEDAQIGAAVRSIHDGCRKALGDVLELKPIMEEGEGSTVTVAAGFDARAIRLTGNVSGEPPFTGILRHRGWKAERIELPKLVADREKNRVIAPAEVEIEG